MRVTLSLLLILVMGVSSAQENDFRNLRIGFMANPGLSWARAEGALVENEKLTLGFEYGLFGDVYFHQNYAFSTGLFLQHFQTRLNYYPGSDSSLIHIYRKQYIGIPVTLKLKTNEIGYITYFGQFGVIPSFRLRARGDLNPDFDGATLEDENLIDRTSIMDMALSLGGGIEYSLSGKTAVVFGLEYRNGFINQVKDKDQADFEEGKVLSNKIMLKLGILF